MKQVLAFVLLAGVLCWLMFAPVYRHVLIMRQALLQKEVDYLLETGASGARGYIDEQMIAESRARLEDRGLAAEALSYDVSAEDGRPATNPEEPVPRGVGIRLTIRFESDNLLVLDRLVGAAQGSTIRIGASGMKMSEYVP
ncbi:hypothetical protein ACFQWB_13780 [Paenibacillus thermoaerophilus]|uniref:Uncharacterized protein n=1 Tax=Paenibacillus thermoaerophilus TaxID=1215385 RepID=A0ABW2V4A6_9BACL|nr:hypothetical protein [Paenibacillus thermoaerophilus]TMV16112.1 hypothetical protein FE781_08555 [Paenibacillus thermoaerophilus]